MVCGNSGKIVSFCLGMMINSQLLIGKSGEEIVKHYFLAGFSFGEILEFLKCYHNVNITLRQLNRILRKNSLYRRHMKTSLNAVIMKIKERLERSNRSYGYSSMHLTTSKQWYHSRS